MGLLGRTGLSKKYGLKPKKSFNDYVHVLSLVCCILMFCLIFLFFFPCPFFVCSFLVPLVNFFVPLLFPFYLLWHHHPPLEAFALKSDRVSCFLFANSSS